MRSSVQPSAFRATIWQLGCKPGGAVAGLMQGVGTRLLCRSMRSAAGASALGVTAILIWAVRRSHSR